MFFRKKIDTLDMETQVMSMSEAQGVEVNEKYKLRLYTASDISDYDDARLELSESGKVDCTRVYMQKDKKTSGYYRYFTRKSY